MSRGLDDLRFSVDYADRENFERERRGLKWASVRDNVIDCKRIRDKKGYGTSLSVRACITRYNRNHLREIKRYWIRYSDSVLFQEEIGVPRPETIKQRFSEIGYRVVCSWPDTKFVVKSNGVASMCCRDWYLQYPIGKLRLGENSLDVFNSKVMKIYRRQLRTSTIPTLCAFCNDRERITSDTGSFLLRTSIDR